MQMMQMPLFMPKSTWQLPVIGDLPSWKNVKRIAIDCETRDEKLKKLGIGVRRGAYIVGVSFTIEDSGQSYYLPIRHQGGFNLPENEVLNYLRLNAAIFEGQLVGANLGYDLDYLWEEKIFFPKVSFYRDIQIADPLIYELHNSYSLKNIGARYGIDSKDENILREAAMQFKVDPKSELWKLPGNFVGRYAEQDSISPLQILREQEKVIERDDLWQIWNLESKVLPVLLKMRRRGVRIDLNKLAEVEHWCLEEEKKALKLVKDETGYDIGLNNIMKAEALAQPLQHIGIKLLKTSTGKPNIDKAVLAGIDHPVGKALSWARKTNKLRTTFAASVREYMVEGRIHCTFNQIAMNDDSDDKDESTVGGRYGRLSCKSPNLQQQPSKDEFANFWRSIYIPEEGAIWGCNDYSQQEPRWTTHYAALMKLPVAAVAAAKYRDDPTTDNHSMMAELTGLPRKRAKDVFLGLCYGEGGAKLCRDLGLPTRWAVSFSKEGQRGKTTKYYEEKYEAMAARSEWEGHAYIYEAAGLEGQNILDTFDQRAPFIRKLAQAAEKQAKQKGVVRTICNRALHFPQKKDGSFDWCYKALNRVIQGSSADQTKTAMAMIDQEMPDTYLQLQVHDEMDGSYASVDEAQRVAKIMRECIPNTLVPFKVDVEMGPSWGEIKLV